MKCSTSRQSVKVSRRAQVSKPGFHNQTEVKTELEVFSASGAALLLSQRWCSASSCPLGNDPSVQEESLQKLLRGPQDRAAFFYSGKINLSLELDK